MQEKRGKMDRESFDPYAHLVSVTFGDTLFELNIGDHKIAQMRCVPLPKSEFESKSEVESEIKFKSESESKSSSSSRVHLQVRVLQQDIDVDVDGEWSTARFCSDEDEVLEPEVLALIGQDGTTSVRCARYCVQLAQRPHCPNCSLRNEREAQTPNANANANASVRLYLCVQPTEGEHTQTLGALAAWAFDLDTDADADVIY